VSECVCVCVERERERERERTREQRGAHARPLKREGLPQPKREKRERDLFLRLQSPKITGIRVWGLGIGGLGFKV